MASILWKYSLNTNLVPQTLGGCDHIKHKKDINWRKTKKQNQPEHPLEGAEELL